MRLADIISEGMQIPVSHSSAGVNVYSLKTREQLAHLLKKARHHDIRGVLIPDEILVWDASQATHQAFEKEFGYPDGIRILINQYEVEYSGGDVKDVILAHPIMSRLFPNLARILSNTTAW